MPAAVSRKQLRMMHAILAQGNKKVTERGDAGPSKAVARAYVDQSKSSKDLPDSKHKGSPGHGGVWGEEHIKRAKQKTKERKKAKKKSKRALKKAFEEFYKGKGQCAATLIMDNSNRILLGTHNKGGLSFPGGHLEPNESFEDAALRELNEEAGVVGRLSGEIYRGITNGNNTVVYLAEIVSGKPKDTFTDKGHESMTNWKWYDLDQIPWDKLRDCCREPIEKFISSRFGKSLKGMMALEELQKNIIRQKGDAVLEVSHGDALRLVGNGMFRVLREAVSGMEDEDFKDVKLDTYVVSIRKHMSDVYSGRVNDGHKTVYQFTNKSLPELTAALMSVFEWYLPEDEGELELLDDGTLSDDAIEGGLNHLIDNYKKHNIGNIYQEMETIREQMRNGMAIDLQQVEGRIMKLFDKLEEATHEMSGKHNKLIELVSKDFDELEAKLRELQQKLDSSNSAPQTMEAYSSDPANKDMIHDQFYSYLSKPRIEIKPNGKITIMFGGDWQEMERVNFLSDMRAKLLKPKKDSKKKKKD